jgi:signal peptidase
VKRERDNINKDNIEGTEQGVSAGAIQEEEPVSAGYKVMDVLKSIYIYVLSACIIIAAILFATNKSPQKSMFGYRYYTVLTASMEPELSVGDLVIVKLANADDINEGDVITFNPSSESAAYLTHRVTEKLPDYEGSGVTCFRTKGDANEDEDGFLLDSSRLIGKVSFHIPKVGYIIRFVQLKWYFVIPLVIMIYIFFQLMKTYFSDESEEEETNVTTNADAET